GPGVDRRMGPPLDRAAALRRPRVRVGLLHLRMVDRDTRDAPRSAELRPGGIRAHHHRAAPSQGSGGGMPEQQELAAMIFAETASSGPAMWVYFVGAAGAVLVFLAGLAIGPFVKSREALFQEQRH